MGIPNETSFPYLLTGKTFTVTYRSSRTNSLFHFTEKLVYEGLTKEKRVKMDDHTKQQDKLFLQDGEGHLHDVSLTNLPITVDKGHEITIIWPLGKKPEISPEPVHGIWSKFRAWHTLGTILAIKNHHTGKLYTNEPMMHAMARHPWWVMIPGLAVSIFFSMKKWMVLDAGMGIFLLSVLLATGIWKFTWNPQKYHQLKALVYIMFD
jgi:hypothetical protein